MSTNARAVLLVTLGVLAVVFLGALLFSGSDGTEVTDDAGVPDGEAIYSASCASCHGASGEGGTGVPLDSLETTRDEVREVIAEGATGMPSFGGRFTDAELEAVTAYTIALGND